MTTDKHIAPTRGLVIPGWYPGVKEPYNGDFVREQVRLLRRDGYHLDLVYADLNVAYGPTWLSWRKRHMRDTHGHLDLITTGTFWPKNTSWGLHKYISAYANCVREYIQLQGPPAVIHAHTYLGAAVAIKASAAHDIPIRTIEHYTGWIDKTIPTAHQSIGIEALNQCDEVVAVSRYLADHLETILDRKVGVQRNFIDTEFFRPPPQKQSDPSSKVQLICIGDLISRKQVDHAIEALSHLPDHYHLTIVGSGPERTRLQDLIKEKSLADSSLGARITFAGQQDRYGVRDLLWESDMLIHPSRLETFGLVVLEALSCGLQVVSYDNGGVQEMGDIPGLCIVEDNLPKALAAAIQKQSATTFEDSPK